MSRLVDQLLQSPRAKVYLDEIVGRLRREDELRQRFREEMTEDTRAEFINGEVVVQSPARFGHNKVAQRAFKLLDAHVARRQLGFVGHEKFLVELTRNDVEPDVCFWSRAKSAKFTDDQLLFPPPDLAVEVLSESTERIDRGTKFEDYAAHGVIEYWIVDADRRVLEQYVLRGDTYELAMKAGDGTVRCVAVQGAEFPVQALFDDAEHEKALAGAENPTA
jgi:Uma2 family endonuclease